MQDQQLQLIERLKQAQNILVTVSTNPSVDQLAAAIGLTLVLNHMGKHATAVYSGQTPSTLEFLKPEDTLEKNTDSLRDFIIALDKSKADKLRYKVEDQVVRIFITPYKTSISEKDLDFSQGDFNVDVVIGLGVREQQDLDSAITAHGRILHDATVASLTLDSQSSLGSINWSNPKASSLSELVADLANQLDKQALDAQVSTALLTGIVASTERFRNDRTTPATMSVSAELMANGANQQLIATELETPAPASISQPSTAPSDRPEQPPAAEPPEKPKPEPGTLEIEHDSGKPDAEEESPYQAETPTEQPATEPAPQVQVDADGNFKNLQDSVDTAELLPEISRVRGVASDGSTTQSEPEEESRTRMSEPPQRSGQLTANTEPEELDPAADSLTQPTNDVPVLHHDTELPAPPLEDEDQAASNAAAKPADAPLLTHNETVLPPFDTLPDNQQSQFEPPQAVTTSGPSAAPGFTPSPVSPDETLAEIEQSVDSPHLHTPEAEPETAVDDARSAVETALSGAADPLQPIAALNAQPLGGELHEQPAAALSTNPTPMVQPSAYQSPFGQPNSPGPINAGFSEPTPGTSPADQTLDMPLPGSPLGPPASTLPQQLNGLPSSPFQSAPSSFPAAPQQGNTPPNGPGTPPPVPPPMTLPPLQ